MSNVLPFRFDSHEVRVVTDGQGAPWFPANAVCAVLGYGNPRQAVESHIDPDDVQKLDVIDSLGRTQLANHINESGLYALILGSTKDEAKRFKRWVTSDVLPAIRKTGSYALPQHAVARASAVQLQPVRDLLLVGRAMSRVKGVNEALAMAYTLDAIEKSTGLPATMLAKALPAVAPDEVVTLNATQVGEPLSLSNQAANRLLEELGFQYRDESKRWNLTEAGTAYGEAKPFHRRGHSGYEIRWKASVVEVIRKYLSSSAASA
ncbi:BRO-N domain-containing protein [Burkholderia plantarii]|uniref:Putative BRO family protein n=1 Tax=Burkholderia plantarii TaxID=41899 RepID=A0A0B6RYS2_BURPL|nr:BRO family protein [Burkholderia plantarii]AJK46220.1 putative BRO family protein [Burkholderia plantarii]